MSSKHFINDPTHLVLSSLCSLTYTNPNVALDEHSKIVYRRPSHRGVFSSSDDNKRVSLISGGGSGHEPSFAGLVGPGLLDAAVAGTIFASPSAEQVRVGILGRVKKEDGVLVIVLNYTGDVLNFGVAVEKARAAGRQVEMVVVGDDVGVGRKAAGKVGRRGIAGTVLVVKIAGALSEMGYDLGDVTKVARLVAKNIVSVGASLERVHVPGRAVTHDEAEKVGDEEVEIGMGIHNEPGSGREKVDLPGLVGKMLDQLLDEKDGDRAFLRVNSNEVVLLINNLGGVSSLELGGITAEVVRQLEKKHHIRPVRILSGTYMTSLNGNGFSISLLNVVNTNLGGPSMIELLDFPSEAPGWSAPISKVSWEQKGHFEQQPYSPPAAGNIEPSGLKYSGKAGEQALHRALKQVIEAEPTITRFDDTVGDGDCGTGLKRGAQAILDHLKQEPLSGDAVVDVAKIATVVEGSMDGTSGALYAIFLNSLVHQLGKQAPGEVSNQTWATALQESSQALAKYTPAKPGDRTIVDALHPFIEVLSNTASCKKAAEAAWAGANETKGMRASLGRTVYVGGKGFEEVPDPGAWGLACFFGGLAGIDRPKSADEDWETV